MIPYVEINDENQTAQLLTAGRSSGTKHARGSGIISDIISLAVAQQSCGAAGSGHKRPIAFAAPQFLEGSCMEKRRLLKQMFR
jgi:hypothetical protein